LDSVRPKAGTARAQRQVDTFGIRSVANRFLGQLSWVSNSGCDRPGSRELLTLRVDRT